VLLARAVQQHTIELAQAQCSKIERQCSSLVITFLYLKKNQHCRSDEHFNKQHL
jgi:hypothetical protein